MQKERKVLFAGFFLTAILLCLLIFPSCKRFTSQDRRQVILYCSVDQTVAEPIIAEFEKLTDIKVLARFDTEASKTVGLVQRIRAEASSPVADVFWSSEIFHTIRLARESLLGPYSGDQSKYWPVGLVDADARWYGFSLRVRVIGYNTKRVSSNDAPRSLEGLLEGKWKGRVVMAAPEFGTTGGDVASWFAHYGGEQARKILQLLKNNKIRLVDGNSTAVRMVATGQADVCLTDTDDVYAAQRNGWPVAMNYLDQGGDGALAIPNTAAIIKGGPNPEEAGELMDFLLSERLEEMLARSDSRNFPIRPSLAEHLGLPPMPKLLDVEYEKIADQLPTAIQTAREILR